MSEFYSYSAQPFVEPQSYVDPQLFAGKPAVDPFDFEPNELASKAALEFALYGQSPADVLAPHPEQFDAELDSSLAAFDADVLSLPHSFLDPTVTDGRSLLSVALRYSRSRHPVHFHRFF